jgi:protease IV
MGPHGSNPVSIRSHRGAAQAKIPMPVPARRAPGKEVRMKTLGKLFLVLVGILVGLEIVAVVVTAYWNHISPNTVLALRLSGNIPEQAPEDLPSQLLTGRVTTVTDILEGLDRARSDPRISGIEVRVAPSSMNMGKLQEVRDAIRRFNRSGKFSVAYLEYATNGPYFLASACQTVVLMPKSLLYLRGLMASTTFYRGALDKLGIFPDFLHVGEYKNAPNVYTEKKYTSAHRAATEALLEDWNSQFLRGIAEARGMPPEKVASQLAQGPFTSQEALAAKLVDRLGYADEARELIKQKNRGSENRLTLGQYLQRTEREGAAQLAVIYAVGEIVPGKSGRDPLGEQMMGSDTIAEQFRRVREDTSIKAVILRVDSPGGVPFSSEVIRRELAVTRRSKPVVVSMSDVAASGGYWISMSANQIVAEPGTLTGSIGVYTGKFNLLGLYEKLGLSKDYVATAENATLDWPFKNYTPEQRKLVMKNLQETYQEFLQGVAEGRHMTVEAVDRIAQGRVWTGERAIKLGLVDKIGGLDTAIETAKQLAGIPAGEKVGLVFLPRPKSLLEVLRQAVGGASILTEGFSLRPVLSRIETLARLPLWAIMPAVPRVE